MLDTFKNKTERYLGCKENYSIVACVNVNMTLTREDSWGG